MLVYTEARMQEPGRFRVHETTFVLDGSGLLLVVDTRDYSVSDSEPLVERLEQGQDLCGSAVNGGLLEPHGRYPDARGPTAPGNM